MWAGSLFCMVRAVKRRDPPIATLGALSSFGRAAEETVELHTVAPDTNPKSGYGSTLFAQRKSYPVGGLFLSPLIYKDAAVTQYQRHIWTCRKSGKSRLKVAVPEWKAFIFDMRTSCIFWQDLHSTEPQQRSRNLMKSKAFITSTCKTRTVYEFYMG